MPPSLTRQDATRAIDAWALRLLPSPAASHRPDGQISAFDKEVGQLREQALESLVQVLAEMELNAGLCRSPDQARQRVAARFAESGGLLAERVRALERTVGQNPPLWRRYRPLISSIRELSDPESDACGGIVHEICFILALSGGKSLPWARRT